MTETFTGIGCIFSTGTSNIRSILKLCSLFNVIEESEHLNFEMFFALVGWSVGWALISKTTGLTLKCKVSNIKRMRH